MTNSRFKDSRDDELQHGHAINLRHFPPKLRKLAKYMLENEERKTISEACRDLNLNIKSIFTMIHRSRQNGNDFSKFLDNISDNYLNLELINVDKAVLEGALTGSARDRELYYKRINKLNDKPQIEINNTLSLTYAVQVNEAEQTRPKGQNDLKPYIPVKRK